MITVSNVILDCTLSGTGVEETNEWPVGRNPVCRSIHKQTLIYLIYVKESVDVLLHTGGPARILILSRVVVHMNQTSLYCVLISMSLLLLISTGTYAADIEAGRVAATQCAICHGGNGEGNGAPKSKISGMDVDVFIKRLNDYKCGELKNVMMERFTQLLTDQDIENLAAYYATK